MAWLNKEMNNNQIFLYYAEIKDPIAGVAVMLIHKGVAIMADAATLPDFRRIGI